MKKFTLLIFAFYSLMTTMEAQFIHPDSSVYGSRSNGVENRQEPTVSIEELLTRLQGSENQAAVDFQQFTIAERQALSTYFRTQNSGNRGPQATLLDEGFDDITTMPGAGFSFVNASDAPNLDWFQGNNTVFPSQSGGTTSYIGANFNSTSGSIINNFMITPVLNLENGDEIKFWTRGPAGSTFPDRLEVRVDPTGANTNPSGPASVGSYTELLLEINPTLTVGGYPQVWTEFTVVVSGLTGATNTRVAFRYWVTNAGPAGANSDYIGIDTLTIEEGGSGGTFPAPYCGPLDFTSNVEPITLVDFAGINNVTSAVLNGTPDHEDFTAISGDVEQDMSYPIAMEGNTDGNFTNRFVVFIDWNQNEILNDAGEVYEMTDLLINSTGTDGQQVNGDIAVPADAMVGTTRMRVKKIFGTTNFLDPCLATGFGQAEDYSINVTAGGGGGGCTAGIYTDRAAFNAEAGSINLEDFAGGPASIIQCGLVISNTGDSCFAPGEILPGIEITANNSAGGQTVYVDPADGFGNTVPVVGSNTFVDYTIINFPNNDVNSFGFDLITLLGTGPVQVRIFGAGGLIDTQVANGTNPETFWGYIASETIVRVELEDLSGTNIEGIGMLAFGQCSGGGGTCVSTAYDSTAVPFDIDGAGDQTADCTNAPNLIPITVADLGTIGSGTTLENITIDIVHTFTADLDLYLVSPSGTELLLANDLGGGTDNGYNGTMFEDGGADISIATAPFGVGPYEPMGGTFATAFAGEDITGDWNLKLCDDAGGDTGQVIQFSMSICVPPVISYDDCSGAIALSCGDSVVGETLTATDSGGNAAPDVFYKFTGSGTPQLVTISLCGGGTDYDSLLRVFDDCDLANELVANDDFCGLQSEVTFQSDGTSTYYIMVEGFGSNAGNFSLDVTCVDPLPNDGCEGAIAVSCGGSVSGSTVGATTDAAPTCGTSITSPGVWYTLDDNSGLPGDITLSLCNGTDYDSKISVYSGSCAALVCVDGNDDACGLQSEISFASDGNTTYFILIHGFGGATGNFTLDVTCTPTPPPNDMIVNSIDVDEIGFPYTDPSVAMPAATTENGNPAGCDLTGANGVWYNFVSAGDGTATAMIVTPGGASSVTFYTAPDESSIETDLTLVPQNSNQCLPGTSASIFTLAGQAYYVFVLNSGAVTDIVIDGTNLGTADNTIAGFSYYPNPTTGVLNLKSVDNIEHVLLYNLLGQVVIDNRVNATTSQVDITGLSTGTYLMKVTVNGETGTYKVLKQ